MTQSVMSLRAMDRGSVYLWRDLHDIHPELQRCGTHLPKSITNPTTTDTVVVGCPELSRPGRSESFTFWPAIIEFQHDTDSGHNLLVSTRFPREDLNNPLTDTIDHITARYKSKTWDLDSGKEVSSPIKGSTEKRLRWIHLPFNCEAHAKVTNITNIAISTTYT
jgi:hypothetical protein